MGKINYKKLEKIAFKSDEFFIERKHHSFCSWAKKHCKNCSSKENLAVCQNWNCQELNKFYNSGYYKNLFLSMPEYELMKIKKRGRIYEETFEGITRKVHSARKEHKCDWCGKTINVGSPYLSTVDFSQKRCCVLVMIATKQ